MQGSFQLGRILKGIRTIINLEDIGKTSNGLVARWNTEKPTGQVVFSEN